MHVLSVDVEDYFQVEAFAACVARETWGSFPSRVELNTNRLLDLFDNYNTKATFFIVGWVAAKAPALVRAIVSRGHEIACHSYWHRCIYRLSPEEFRSDTRQAKDVIEQAAGIKVRGYRAPSWSITSESLWALNILAEEGFEYDSSIYPIHHDIYGIPGGRPTPYVHALSGGRRLPEFPPATVQCLGATLPAAGGGYLRILPYWYTRWAFHQMAAFPEMLPVVYIHPWEIDQDQPRVRGASLRSRFRHYTNLAQTENRLKLLLRQYDFTSFENVIASRSRLSEPELELRGVSV